MISQKHKLNALSEQILFTRTYNELGQLSNEKIANYTATDYLQTNDYKYNIRSWLSFINSPTTASGKLLNLWLDYTYNSQGYNGNITHSVWSKGDLIKKDYVFTYDPLNRLLTSTYTEFNNGFQSWGEAGKYNENYSYDVNGNIRTVKRSGLVMDGSGYIGLIDSMKYIYYNNNRSNRLWSVGDAAPDITARGDFSEASSYNGFTTQEYYYDNNGNLTDDRNKGFRVLNYNYLNLPKDIYLGYVGTFTYTANGEKLQSVTKPGSVTETNDYVGPFVYKNNVLDYIITANGRMVFSGGTFSYYEFNVKDHLGNTRVAFKKSTTNTPEILQRNDYYPFGLLMAERTDIATNKNRYLYNGKENIPDAKMALYDYGARFYDPQIGRWHFMRPLGRCIPKMESV